MLDSLKQNIWHDRDIREPGRPELPAGSPPKPTEQPASCLPARPKLAESSSQKENRRPGEAQVGKPLSQQRCRANQRRRPKKSRHQKVYGERPETCSQQSGGHVGR